MPCCKAEKYGWCGEKDTVYTDKKGNKYCVFHAPKEKKEQTQDNYNKLIYKRIQEAIDEKRECNLSGTIFPYIIDFYNFEFPHISFKDAIFSERAYFNYATFSGERASFDHTTFSENTDFIRANFSEDAEFSYTTFSGDANFSNATFSGDADFSNATFSGGANFLSAIFIGIVYYINATFRGADFSNSTFSERTDFTGATFSDYVAFIETKFVGETMFTNAKFKQYSIFEGCKVDYRMYFEDVNLSSALFLDTDIKNMIFQGCSWFKKYKYGRNKVADEVVLKNKKSKNKLLDYEQVEDLYRKLKHKYKTENNEPEVSSWHYGEKEMFRKKMNWRRFNPVSFSNLYWAFSGYGERPIRAGIVLILLFVSVTILMNVFGLISTPSGQEKFGVEIIKGFSGVIEWKKFWFLLLNTIQNVLFIRNTFFEPQTLTGAIILTIITKLIIPIQAALFVFALRNKFRR